MTDIEIEKALRTSNGSTRCWINQFTNDLIIADNEEEAKKKFVELTGYESIEDAAVDSQATELIRTVELTQLENIYI